MKHEMSDRIIPDDEGSIDGEEGESAGRPMRLEPMMTGKRTKTLWYGIKQTSEYVDAAEAYMDTIEALLALKQ